MPQERSILLQSHAKYAVFSQSSFSYVITNFYQANINQQIICEFCNFTPGYAFLSFVLSILQQKEDVSF